MNPLVSVIIPVYNRESTIMRSINSVLKQTYTNIEVIIVDDCSTDSTVNVVNECSDERLRVFRLTKNQGANIARNIGIREAKGEYIAFQDSDDEWLEKKLEKQLSYIHETNVQALYCPYILYDEEKTSMVPEEYLDMDRCEKCLADTLREKNVIGTPTLIVCKDVFSEVGLFDEEMKRLQDYEFVIRLAKSVKIGYVNEPLVKAYRMPISISSDISLLVNAYAKILEKHADFVNVETIFQTYLRHADLFWQGNVDWKLLDEVITSIVLQNFEQRKENLYKMAAQYFIEQRSLKQRVLEEWYEGFKKNIENEKFAIYGAGVYGKKAFQKLKKEGFKPKFFLVTKLGESTEIDGIQVEQLGKNIENNFPIIIAVSEEKQQEIIKNLLDREIYRFCIYPGF